MNSTEGNVIGTFTGKRSLGAGHIWVQFTLAKGAQTFLQMREGLIFS